MTTETLDLNELYNSANLLAENANVILEDLDKSSHIYKAYQTVLYAYTTLHNTDPEIIYNILEKLPKPTTIVEQSAGAFLFSDYYACYGMKNTSTTRCTPIMINNTTNRRPSMFKAKSGDDRIFILKGQNLIYLSTDNSTNVAKIFLETEDIGLREKHIKSLKDHGIEYVKLVAYEKDSHRIIQDITHIDDILILEEDDVYYRNDNNHKNDSSNNGVIGWLIVVLIIVLIIIALIFYFRNDVFLKK